MRRCVFFLLFLFFLAPLRAEIIWARERGWFPSPDVTAAFNDAPEEALKLMNEASLAQDDERISTALTKYEMVCRRFPDTIFAPEAYYQIGKIRVSKNQFNDAFKAFNSIAKKYPEYPHFSEVLREEFEIARLLKSGERPKFFGIIPGFRDYTGTMNFYKKVIEDAPFSEIAPLALQHMGELALAKGQPLDAIAAFERLIDEYPYSEYTPEAYHSLGEIYASITKSPFYDQGSTRLAMNYYEDFLTLYPDHELAPDARKKREEIQARLARSKLSIGDFYFNDRNNRKAAIVMYKRAKQVLPDSETAQEAEARIREIKEGKEPPKTPVDFLFGKYERPADEREEELAVMDGKESEKLEFDSDLIRINSGRAEPRNFVSPEDYPVDDSFLEIGPQKTF
jgi:outer membrane protein assembly factor BamD